MPTVFSHPAPMLALAAIMGGRVSSRMLLFGVLCAVLPDADVIGFRFGISYADAFGHRGFSHSLAFALLMGCVGFGTAPLLLRGSRLMGFFIGFLAVSSHILLDAMTNGGLGVAAFWPFDQTRYFCGWRPIRVSPFSLKALLSERGLAVMLSELRWIWAPCLAVIAAALFFRKKAYAAHAEGPLPAEAAHKREMLPTRYGNSWSPFHNGASIKRPCHRKRLMLFSLKLQRDNQPKP